MKMSSSRRKKQKIISKPLKAAVSAVLCSITTEIESLKADNGGKTPYHALVDAVSANKINFPWLNVNKLKNHLKKLKKEESDHPSKTNETQQMGLSSMTPSEPEKDAINQSIMAIQKAPLLHTHLTCKNI